MNAETPGKPVDLTKHLPPTRSTPNRPFPNSNAEIRRQYSEPSRLQKMGRQALDWWRSDERPGIFELHYFYFPVYGALAIGAAGVGVAVSDDVLGTHFANDIANVCVNKKANDVVQFLQDAIQETGKQAGGKTTQCTSKPTDVPKPK